MLDGQAELFDGLVKHHGDIDSGIRYCPTIFTLYAFYITS